MKTTFDGEETTYKFKETVNFDNDLGDDDGEGFIPVGTSIRDFYFVPVNVP